MNICYIRQFSSLSLGKQIHWHYRPSGDSLLNGRNRFVVGLAITFRMQSSYNRWWDGRTQWDKLSAVSRSLARTLWFHVPDMPPGSESMGTVIRKEQVIRCVHTFAVALKHHLRGEREWQECHDLKHGISYLRNVPTPPCLRSSQLTKTSQQYNLAATNHPLTLTLHLSTAVESYRSLSDPKIDTQVLTHLLTHVDTLTSILSACERFLRTPIPLGYNIAISRIVWIFIFTLPGQLWAELKWWSVAVTGVTAYALFALAEVGLEIENVGLPFRLSDTFQLPEFFTD
jgi:putative membrane protein